MKLRLNRFLLTLAMLTASILLSLSVHCLAGEAQKQSDGVKVTFVEIGAARCIPCKAMQPIMKEVAEEYKGQVKVVFHDVWTQQGKMDAEKYNIRVIPTQVFLDRDGKEYFRHEGYFPKDDLIKVIKMQGVQ